MIEKLKAIVKAYNDAVNNPAPAIIDTLVEIIKEHEPEYKRPAAGWEKQ